MKFITKEMVYLNEEEGCVWVDFAILLDKIKEQANSPELKDIVEKAITGIANLNTFCENDF